MHPITSRLKAKKKPLANTGGQASEP